MLYIWFLFKLLTILQVLVFTLIEPEEERITIPNWHAMYFKQLHACCFGLSRLPHCCCLQAQALLEVCCFSTVLVAMSQVHVLSGMTLFWMLK